MEIIIIKTIVILSIIAMCIGVADVDKALKEADINEKVRLQVNYILLLFGAIVSILSGYILFFV